MSVPLPPPDGELTTKSVPREAAWLAVLDVSSSFTLLDILNLFAKFLDLRLDRQAGFLNHQVRGLRKRRVGFAIELLQKEIKHLAGFTRSIERLLKLRQVTTQADHLFTHVTTVRKVSNFLRQPHRIDFDDLPAAVQQFANAFLQTQPVSICETGGRGFDYGHERF